MDFPLDNTDITTLRQKMSTGVLSCVELTQGYLSRIREHDRSINAILQLNPDALEIARQRDVEQASDTRRGPLHGIPVLVKDNLDSGDSMPTTAGSIALADNYAATDSHVIHNLRAAGAVILGKTNLSEWANFRSTRSASGWSSLGGQTRNPYALDRTPSGSSSGSGAAVAAGLCAAAVGTETDGSIISPSAMNGVVGIKPTVGLVSRQGIIPISNSQDTAGPIARSVADAALLLGAMLDVRNAAGRQDTHNPDYTAVLTADGLATKRIGACPLFAQDDERIAPVFQDAVRAILSGGATVIEDIDLPTLESVREPELTVLCTEFRHGLNAYLKNASKAPVHDLDALIAFNREHAETVMPYFQQELLERSASSAGLDDPAYRNARSQSLYLVREQGLDRALSQHQLDAIVVPSASIPWMIDWISGDNRSGSSAYLAAISGYPSITVPAGYVHDLPVGISFIAAARQEPLLIELAHAFETLTQIRRPPAFRETITGRSRSTS